jgi:hypothetical protein
VTKFYRVNTPTKGRWAGCSFLNVQASSDFHPIRNQGERNAILAQIAKDPITAKALYGQELGQCGHCNRTLTDELSRELGIGPVCRGHLGI